MRVIGNCSWNGPGLLLRLSALLLLSSLQAFAADVPLNPEELYQREVETLLAIAKRGHEAQPEKENVERRVRSTLFGIWSAPWVYHALRQIGSEPQGRDLEHFLNTTDRIDHAGKSEGPEISVSHGTVRCAPQLPAELEALSEEVWEAYFDVIRRYYEQTRPFRIPSELARRICETCAPPRTLLRVARKWFEDPKNPPGIRAVAGYLMGAAGHDEPKVTSELIGGLTAPDACIRIMCAEGLGRQAHLYSPFGGSEIKPSHPCPVEATRALVTLLDDTEKEVRIAALRALGSVAWQARGAGPALLEFARKNRPGNRKEAEVAEGAMGNIGVPELADHLLPVIASAQDAMERRMTVQNLWHLAISLKESDPAAFEQVGGRIGPTLCEMCTKDRVPEGISICIGRFSPHVVDAVPTLEKLLDRLSPANKEEREEMGKSIWALGEIGPAAACTVPKLLKLAADPNMKPELSHFANAFRGIGVSNKDVTACLLTLITGVDRSYFRADVVEALGVVGVPTEEAVMRLEALLHDPDAQVAHQAEEALEKLKTKSVIIKDAEGF